VGLLRVGQHLATDRRNRLLDIAHFASAGAASSARGLNDTLEMAALLLIVPSSSEKCAILFMGIMIAVGAMSNATKVAETQGKEVTDMTAGQGFSANLVTAILVTTASFHNMPVSTTHVSVGSLLGMGVITKQAKGRKVAKILIAWITTVPYSPKIPNGLFVKAISKIAVYRSFVHVFRPTKVLNRRV
jgi:PiT family inorganic phosphate transporter